MPGQLTESNAYVSRYGLALCDFAPDKALRYTAFLEPPFSNGPDPHKVGEHQQYQHLAGNRAGIGRLFGNDRIVLLQFLEKSERRIEIGGRAAERQIDCNGADISDRSRQRIEITHHPLIVGLKQIFPTGRHRLATERILVHEQAERAGMNRGPVAVGVL